MPKPDINTCDRVLIVEGKDDLSFFAELLEWLDNGAGVWIEHVGGKSRLPATIKAMFRPAIRTKRAVAVIADADENPQGTAQSLAHHLSTITGQNVTSGAFTQGTPRIGLFVVPHDQPGEIETLVWQSWAGDPSNAEQRTCVESYLACMDAQGQRAHSPDKGKLGALLAVRNDEDPRLGPGARAHVFDFNRPELAPLVAFLRGF
ncbi:MAG: DUF3226 domain-containing protein [Byssovorax sp.]